MIVLCMGVTPNRKQNFDKSVLFLLRWKGQSQTSTTVQLLVLICWDILFTALQKKKKKVVYDIIHLVV